MENHINVFNEGMDKDSTFLNIKNSSYLHALNAVNTESDNSILAIMNELGFSVISDYHKFSALNTKPNKFVIGLIPANDSLIVFSVELDGSEIQNTISSEVGEIVNLSHNPTYRVILNDSNPTFWENGLVKATELWNFNIKYQIDATYRVNFNNKRIVYWVDGLNTDRFLELDRDYAANPVTNLSQETAQQNIFDKAIVQYKNQIPGGAILPGVYQFAIRYLNQTLDTTDLSFISNIIPVVDEARAVGRSKYDGANFDSNPISKSIVLDVLNIDQDYEFIQLVVIYYLGSTSQFAANVVKTLPITGTTMEVVFNGEIGQELVIDEIVKESVIYKSSKHIIQKDGRLVKSNLKAVATTDFQMIANKVYLSYEVNEVLYDENNQGAFDNYKEENNTFENKGFRRAERYSFALVGVFKDGSKSFSAHIPGYPPGVLTTDSVYYTGTFPNILGTFASTELYSDPPDTTNYYQDFNGNNLDGTRILHHVMPTLEMEPHFRFDGSNVYIRVLGIKINGLKAALDQYPEIRDNLDYVLLVMEERNSINKKSIHSMGCINKLLYMDGLRPASAYTTALLPPIDVVTLPSGHYYNEAVDNTPVVAIDPCFNGTQLTHSLSQNAFYVNGRGFIDNGTNYYSDRAFGFFSPESILAEGTFSLPVGAKIQKVATTKGTIFFTGNTKNADAMRFLDGNYDRCTDNPFLERSIAPHAWFHLDSKQDINFTPTSPIVIDKIQRVNGTGRAYNPSSVANLVVQSQGKKVINYINEGYFLIETVDSVPTTPVSVQVDLWVNFDPPIPLTINCGNNYTLPVDGSNNYDENGDNTRTSDSDGYRELYNIITDNPTQYGQLNANSYILVDVLCSDLIANSNPLNSTQPIKKYYVDSTDTIFNGDTFITRFYFRCSQNFDAGVNSVTNTLNPLDIGVTLDALQDLNLPNETGVSLRGSSYVFVESEHNAEYRHRVVETDSNGNTILGPAYFPKDSLIDALESPPTFGHPSGYNIQYSFMNSVKTYYGRPFGFVDVYNFPTRSIYSEQSIQGEQSDYYRIFLPNSYQDLPKNKGEITNQFIQSGVLYLHTDKSLFRTFFNPSNFVQSSEEDIFVGNGSIFGQPPIEIYTLDGGYAGCIHKWASINTPFGFVFPDYYQRKVFILIEGLEEISQLKMFNWFNNLDNAVIPHNAKYQDDTWNGLPNPYKNENYLNNPANPLGVGLNAFYDPLLKRYVLSMKRTPNQLWKIKNGKEFDFTLSDNYDTLSFSFLNKSWVSFHSYLPAISTNNDTDVYSWVNTNEPKENKCYKHNFGNYGVYYLSYLYNFEIEIVMNPYPTEDKTFDVNDVLSESLLDKFVVSDRVKQLIEFFNTGEWLTDYQYTGIIPLIVRDNRIDFVDNEFDFNVQAYNRQFQIKIPLAATINNFESLKEISNVNIAENEKARLRAKYCRLKLVYFNEKNLYLLVHNIITKYRKSYR